MRAVGRGSGCRPSVGQRHRDEERVFLAGDAGGVPLAGRVLQEEEAAGREAPGRAVAGGHLVFAPQTRVSSRAVSGGCSRLASRIAWRTSGGRVRCFSTFAGGTRPAIPSWSKRAAWR